MTGIAVATLFLDCPQLQLGTTGIASAKMATSLPLPQVLRSVVARHATRNPEDLQECKLRCAFVGKMRREAPISVNRKVARRQVYAVDTRKIHAV